MRTNQTTNSRIEADFTEYGFDARNLSNAVEIRTEAAKTAGRCKPSSSYLTGGDDGKYMDARNTRNSYTKKIVEMTTPYIINRRQAGTTWKAIATELQISQSLLTIIRDANPELNQVEKPTETEVITETDETTTVETEVADEVETETTETTDKEIKGNRVTHDEHRIINEAKASREGTRDAGCGVHPKGDSRDNGAEVSHSRAVFQQPRETDCNRRDATPNAQTPSGNRQLERSGAATWHDATSDSILERDR